MKVLGRSSSHNVQKVMWCLAELGIDVERVNVGGKFGGNKEESYLRLNPNGVVPTLVDGEVVVWESNSILRYLCNTRANSLYPGDAVHRSEVERWMDWQLTTLVTGIVPLFQSIVRTPKEQQDPEHIERHRLTSLAAMKILENVLSNREHLAASDFSLADICAGPSIYRWFELPIVRPPLPALERWYRAMQHRLGFREHVMVGLA